LYMIVCAVFLGLVILLEAVPVYMLFMADVRGRNITILELIFISFSFVLVLIIMIVSTYIPMRMGVKALEEYE
jgi:ABC-2 type transport system permease protein